MQINNWCSVLLATMAQRGTPMRHFDEAAETYEQRVLSVLLIVQDFESTFRIWRSEELKNMRSLEIQFVQRSIPSIYHLYHPQNLNHRIYSFKEASFESALSLQEWILSLNDSLVTNLRRKSKGSRVELSSLIEKDQFKKKSIKNDIIRQQCE